MSIGPPPGCCRLSCDLMIPRPAVAKKRMGIALSSFRVRVWNDLHTDLGSGKLCFQPDKARKCIWIGSQPTWLTAKAWLFLHHRTIVSPWHKVLIGGRLAPYHYFSAMQGYSDRHTVTIKRFSYTGAHFRPFPSLVVC